MVMRVRKREKKRMRLLCPTVGKRGARRKLKWKKVEW